MKNKLRITMLFCMMCMLLFAVNAHAENALIEAGKTMSITLPKEFKNNNGPIGYDFSVSKRCIVKFTLNVEDSGPSNTSSIVVGLRPWPYNGSMLFNAYKSTTNINYFALMPGNYEICFNKANVTANNYAISGSFRADIVKAESSTDIVGNLYENLTMFSGQTPGVDVFYTNARKITIGKNLYSADGVYYRFDLTADQKVKLECQTAYGDNGQAGQYTIYNSAGTSLYTANGTTTKVYSLKKGTYYIYTSNSVIKTSNASASVSLNGFCYKDGKWKYYKNNQVCTSYTGIIKGTIDGVERYYYVKAGVYTKVSGITRKATGTDTAWYYVKSGIFTKSSGLAQRADGSNTKWYFVLDGVFTKNTGIAKKILGTDTKWYFVLNGVYTQCNGIAKRADGSNTKWYYVKAGVYTKCSGMAQRADGSNTKWYYVKDGAYTKCTGLTQKITGTDTKWYYVKDGAFYKATGITQKIINAGTKWYYVKDGVLCRTTCKARMADGSSTVEYKVINGVVENIETWSEWSSWSTNYVSDSANVEVERRTEYRYSDKEYTTSYSSSLSGWTLYNSSTSYGSYGPLSDWGVNAVYSSDTRRVEQATVYQYYYYLCPYCGNHSYSWDVCRPNWPGWGGCGRTIGTTETCRILYTTVSFASAGVQDCGGSGKYYTDNLSGGRWYQHSGPYTGYRYQDRSKTTTNYFYRWGSWSSWSTSAYTSSSSRQVETRTVYRYRTRY